MKQCILLLALFFVVVPAAQSERIDPVSGDPVKINPAKPPDGMNIIQILLENQSFPLEGTGCDSASENKRTLQHKLAIILGSAIDRGAAIAGACKPEPFELRSGTILNAWRCTLSIPEQTIKGRFIDSYTLFFGVKKDSWKLITDSITPNPLICMP